MSDELQQAQDTLAEAEGCLDRSTRSLKRARLVFTVNLLLVAAQISLLVWSNHVRRDMMEMVSRTQTWRAQTLADVERGTAQIQERSQFAIKTLAQARQVFAQAHELDTRAMRRLAQAQMVYRNAIDLCQHPNAKQQNTSLRLR